MLMLTYLTQIVVLVKSIGGFLLLTEPLPDNIKMDDMHEFLCRVLCVKVHIDVFFSRMQFPELNYEHSHCWGC